MKLTVSNVGLPEVRRRKGPRYTPLSRRQDRPNAILWLLRNHSELKDAQIMRLVGTTKTTQDVGQRVTRDDIVATCSSEVFDIANRVVVTTGHGDRGVS